MESKNFISALDDQKIVEAIGAAEKRTSGEIRVFVSERTVENALEEAQKQFEKLGMTATQQRNGVLLYFAPKSQSFAIIGDRGVHEKCGQPFWEEVKGEMTPLLKAGQFTEAVLTGVRQAGEALARHFPFEQGDRNELPNEIVREKPEPPASE